MSTARYIREYLIAHPDAHRDEVLDRLGYDFEHETPCVVRFMTPGVKA